MEQCDHLPHSVTPALEDVITLDKRQPGLAANPILRKPCCESDLRAAGGAQPQRSGDEADLAMAQHGNVLSPRGHRQVDLQSESRWVGVTAGVDAND